MEASQKHERRSGSLHVAWGVAGLAALLAVLSMTSATQPRPSPQPTRLVRASIEPPVRTGFGSLRYAFDSQVEVSPDGRSIVFVAADRLWIRPLGDPTPRQLAGTEGAAFPFWSPDSNRIGFFADGELRVVDATGGAVTTLSRAASGRGGSWAPDETILFAPDRRGGLCRVSTTGGRPEPVTQPEPSLHTTHRWPRFLPDGESFLFLAASHSNPAGDRNGIYVATLDGASPRPVVAADSQPVVSAGRLLYLRRGDLMAQPFDLGRASTYGEAVTLTPGVSYGGASWRGMFSASNRTVLVYEIGVRHQGSMLSWFDRLGNVEVTVGERASYWDLQLSPRGDRVAVAEGTSEPRIWIWELDREVRRPLLPEASFGRSPVWSPDGERLVYASLSEQGRLAMYVADIGGALRPRRLWEDEVDQVPTSWSTDGRWLAFDQGPPGATEIWVLPIAAAGEPSPALKRRVGSRDGQFSPDGRWLLYTSQESDIEQVWVSAFAVSGDPYRISAAGGGSDARWSPSGDKVYFATSRSMLMEVEVRPRKGGGLDVGVPRMLFSYRGAESPPGSRRALYAIGGDDERLLLAQGPEGGPEEGRLMLVVPWSESLGERDVGRQLSAAGH